LGGGASGDALVEQLEQAKLLVVGAALAAEKGVVFDSPYMAAPPVVVPLSDHVLVGRGATPVGGVQRVAIVADDGQALPVPALVRVPSLPAPHGAVRLSPFVLEDSSIESKERATVRSYGLEGHQAGATVMARSFDLVAAHAPDAHRQIVATIDSIALHDPAEGERSQATLSDLPGTFVMPCSPNPYTNAECIVHEYFHNRLFALEELGPVFADPDEEAGRGEGIFSPWRAEVRPVKGLLHSAYVFAPVAELWLDVWLQGGADELQLAFALDDTIRHRLQLRIGVELLRRRGGLTPWGTSILDALQRRVDGFDQACDEANVPDDTLAMAEDDDGSIRPLRWQNRPRVSVRENIRANIERVDLQGDTRSLDFTV
jgi:HEXXH motif-containing protein